MERLAPTDAWFLYLENPTVHLHVTGVLVLDPVTADGDFGYETVRRHIGQRLPLIPAMHHRLVEVPLGIDHPGWIETEDLDLDDHLEHTHLPQPGSMAGLAEQVGEFASEPLDRSRPLWKARFVDGLADGRAALVIKMHHSTVDGVTGLGVLAQLLDLSPEGRGAEPVPDLVGEIPPPPVGVAAEAALNRVRSPLRPLRSFTRSALSLAAVGQKLLDRWWHGDTGTAHPVNAPRTRFNTSISARRIVAFAQIPLADLKTVKSAFGTTVNDVVLAACTHGLRRYLADHDDLPDRPLVCSIPVSVHRPGAEDGANQVSDMFVNLPVEVDDPVEQLQLINRGTGGAKELQQAVGTHMIGDLVELIPPAVFRLAAGAYSSTGMADSLPPVQNLVVSNVHGSHDPLYLAGAEVVGLLPLGPLMEGTGLNITALSHVDRMHLALVSCPELMPDLADLAEVIIEGVEELLDRC